MKKKKKKALDAAKDRADSYFTYMQLLPFVIQAVKSEDEFVYLSCSFKTTFFLQKIYEKRH